MISGADAGCRESATSSRTFSPTCSITLALHPKGVKANILHVINIYKEVVTKKHLVKFIWYFPFDWTLENENY